MEPHVLLIAIIVGLVRNTMVCSQKNCDFEHTQKTHDTLKSNTCSTHS